MDGNNFYRIELGHLRHLNRGVTACMAGSCPSKVFGCFLFRGNLRFGFMFKNGSNTRVSYLNNNEPTKGTIYPGQCIIMFKEVRTAAGSINNVSRRDFEQLAWFDEETQNFVKMELIMFEDVKDERNELIDMFRELRIDQMHEVKKFIKDKTQ